MPGEIQSALAYSMSHVFIFPYMYIHVVITCPSLGNLINGLVMFTGLFNSRDWEFGTEAVYSCNTGFSLIGNSNRTCTGDGSSTTGSFNGVAPTCEGKY